MIQRTLFWLYNSFIRITVAWLVPCVAQFNHSVVPPCFLVYACVTLDHALLTADPIWYCPNHVLLEHSVASRLYKTFRKHIQDGLPDQATTQSIHSGASRFSTVPSLLSWTNQPGRTRIPLGDSENGALT